MTAASRVRGRRVAACAFLAGLLVGGGCRAGRDGRAAAAAGGGEPDALFGQIDATLTLAIEQSRLASSRATNLELRRFATAQVERYTALRDDLRTITRDREAPPAPVSTVALPGSRRLDALQVARGPQFDRAYVRQALDVHRRLLGDLDLALRRAHDEQLRRALRELRDSVPGQEPGQRPRGAFDRAVAASAPGDVRLLPPRSRVR